ncbi:hypothetical protein SPFM14_00216 [Salmonella phage SPFM14]|nr:hypothetical protein SPFM14_00216 [Salmonella phage SPFM14]
MQPRLAELVLALPKDSQFYYVPILEHCLYLYLNKQPVPSEVAALTYKPYLLSETFYSGSYSSEPVMFPEYQGNAGEDMVAFLPSQIRQLATYDGEWPEFEAFGTMQTRNTIAWSQFSSTRYFKPELLPYVEKECSAVNPRTFTHPPKPVQDIETLFTVLLNQLAMFVKAIGLRTVGKDIRIYPYPRDWKLDGLKAGGYYDVFFKDIETTFVRRFYDTSLETLGGDTLLTPNEYRTFLELGDRKTIRLCTVRTLHYVRERAWTEIATYQIRYTMLYEITPQIAVGDHRHGLFNITAVTRMSNNRTSTLVASITPNEGDFFVAPSVNAPLDRTQDEQRKTFELTVDTQNDSPTQQLLKIVNLSLPEWPVDFYHALSGRNDPKTMSTVTDFDRIPKQYLLQYNEGFNKPQDGVKEASNLVTIPTRIKANKRGDTKFVPVEPEIPITVSC